MESIAKIDGAEMANCKFRSLLLYTSFYNEHNDANTVVASMIVAATAVTEVAFSWTS